MADATVVNTQYGYYVGDGGTDATTVTTSKISVKRLIFVTAASASTITVTEVGGRSVFTFLSTPTVRSESFDMGSIKLNGIVVTLNTTSVDRCIIYTE